MNIQKLNYDALYEQYFQAENVQRAVKILSRFPFDRSADELRSLLRDHRKEPITDEDQIAYRDAFDCLIGFYSLMEVAAIARYVPDPLPKDFQKIASAHLGQPDLRAYYEKYYELLLPQVLRRRLSGELNLHEQAGEGGSNSSITEDPPALYTRFLDVNRLKENDPNVEMFLWLLDDGIEGGYSWIDMLAVLSDPGKYFDHVSRDPEEQTALDHALLGFPKFLNFCLALDSLLERSRDFPFLQSAIWHYHSYWFDQLKDKTGKHLNQAISRLYEWNQYAEDPDAFMFDMSRSVEAIQGATARLLQGSHKLSLEVALAMVSAGDYKARPSFSSKDLAQPSKPHREIWSKRDLVRAIMEQTGLPGPAAQGVMDALLENITTALKAGQSVKLKGFGTFSVTKRKARLGRNPSTGEQIKIAACKIPKFSAAKELKDKLRK